MELDWTEEEAAFRQEVQDFLATELTDDVRGSMFVNTPERVAFVDKLAEKGWLGMGFPEKYGGSPKPFPLAQFILNTELERANAPTVGKNVGTIANTIYHEASEEMKQEFLPRIFRNEGQWSITYTEPSAGTDIGSLQTRAVDKGDHWEVTGNKIFITSAHFARWHWMAVRTDPDAPKHKGISILIVDTDSPGITINPMYCVGSTTAERTNVLFFDKVKVPKDRLVGEENKGFYYMMQALDYERFAIIAAAQHTRRFTKVLAYLKEAEFGGERPLRDDPAARRKVARLASRIEVGNMLERLCICIAAERVPAAEAGMNKAWGSCMQDEVCQVAQDIMGPFGFVAEGEHSGLDGFIIEEGLMAGHGKVAAAGSDVAKSIVARRLLGLPNALGKPELPQR
ncbi:MAG: acyl-CoA dehydrogenase family protein [Halioglobus sp.]|nr:acyl-CoA dehydrogenase family protein [Halioglobus sp.]